MYDPKMTRGRALVATLIMLTIAIVLAAVLYTSVGGCYYDGPRIAFTYRSVNVTSSQLLEAIQAWNRTTDAQLMSYNASDRSMVVLEFSCDGMTGYGRVELSPRDGGPMSTVEVEIHATSMRPRPCDQWRDPFGPSVEQTFAGDREHLEPCVREFQDILSGILGGPPASEEWTWYGLC